MTAASDARRRADVNLTYASFFSAPPTGLADGFGPKDALPRGGFTPGTWFPGSPGRAIRRRPPPAPYGRRYTGSLSAAPYRTGGENY
ncbi:hypothetical protein Afil01_40310 [Actinorhabdospora filicis]|uniref:Uncharacterized protein n=1 Tax=Actinorhabdospora filicis TaxID=1785913 RepID=A0A9W6SNQ2_9ACTN|nr:hypothetical protein Afil01_40310 [Actinorhabdospora filicis]